MRSQALTRDEETTYVLVFDTDDEVVSPLAAFAREHGLTAARFTAIGAFMEATLGHFDWERKAYEEIPLAEQVEVLTLAGDIALKGDEPAVHAHVVLGKRDGSAHGGHLLEARVRPALELVLVESPAYLRKEHDEETGLALIAPRA
jgi:uncharacterized protein